MGVSRLLFNIDGALSGIFNLSKREAGVSLIEAVVAVGVLGIIAVTFLTGVTVTSRAAFITDERATAENLARSQMEWVQLSSYTTNATYTAFPIPARTDYASYSVNITAEALYTPDDGRQKITISVLHSDKEVFTLESYKVIR